MAKIDGDSPEYDIDMMLKVLETVCIGLSSKILGTAEINGCVEPVLKYNDVSVTTVRVGTLLSVVIGETPITAVTKLTIAGEHPLHYKKDISLSSNVIYGQKANSNHVF